MFSAFDHHCMTQALRLAEQGLYTTQPNPRVGCVIAKNQSIIAEGAHHRAGQAHAEINALQHAQDQAQGATLYTTLEPCHHVGRTPPCVDSIIQAGIVRVCVAMIDPNPLISGQGISCLQNAGIEVAVGLLETQALQLNAGFVKRMTQQRPYVRSKLAVSLDGRTALQHGKSQWISGEAARQDGQHWRARSCAVLSGIGTICADNPRLNARLSQATHQPLRVVVDSTCRSTPDLAVFASPNTALLVHAQADIARVLALEQQGIHTVSLPNQHGKVDLAKLMDYLAQTWQVNEVLVEAGATLNGALLEANLVDEWLVYYALRWLGHSAQGMFALQQPLTELTQAQALTLLDMRLLGHDICLRLAPAKNTP